MTNKKCIAISSIFYIMMIILFVTIVIFGMSKVFEVEDVISKQEKLKLILELKKEFEYCSDPLNFGSIKDYRIKNNVFNLIIRSDLEELEETIHILDFINSNMKTQFLDDLKSLVNIDNTIIIWVDTNKDKKITDYKVITSFNYPIKRNSIIKDFSDDSYLNLKIKC